MVATLKGCIQKLIRHVEDEDVTEKAFNSLSMQPRNSSHVSNFKNKKFWKHERNLGQF